MRSLLDVNVLIALLDAAHAHHARARAWISDHIEQGWASCPLTQNGCLRILAQPRYSNPLPLVDAGARLRAAQATKWHSFWSDSISVLDQSHIDLTRVHGSTQLTDVYLLALAVQNNGRLVTFDQRIALSSVIGATRDNLITL